MCIFIPSWKISIPFFWGVCEGPCKCCWVKPCDCFYVGVLSLSPALPWRFSQQMASGESRLLWSPSIPILRQECTARRKPATNIEGFWLRLPVVQSFSCSENKPSIPLPSPGTWLSVKMLPWSSHHPFLLLALSELYILELKYWYTGKNSSPGQSQSSFFFPPPPCSFLCHSWMKSGRTKLFVLRCSSECNMKVLPQLGVQRVSCHQAWPLLYGRTCSGTFKS